MTEPEIRQLIQQEMAKAAQAGRFNLQFIPRHTHNGIDSPQVNQNNINPGRTCRGLITFASNTVYTLNPGFNPTSLFVYGNATHKTGATIDIRAFIIGDARFAPSTYFQAPNANAVITSVATGGKLLTGNPPPQKQADGSYANTIIQSSAYFSVAGNATATTPHALADQFHLIDVELGGVILARADVISFSRDAIKISVVLAAGWQIDANYIVT